MNPASLIHMATAYSMATAYIKATAKGHEANSISYFVLEIKRNLCLFGVLFFRPLISRNIWLKGPVCRSQSSERVTKEPQQAAYRIIHKTVHQGQSILQSSILAKWILSGIDPGTNNDLNYHRVLVPSIGTWGSGPHPPPLLPNPCAHLFSSHSPSGRRRAAADIYPAAWRLLGCQIKVQSGVVLALSLPIFFPGLLRLPHGAQQLL